jgi:hypothetical protein
MADVPDPAQPVDYKAIGELILGALTDNPNISFDGLRGLIVSANTQSHGAKISASLKFATWLAAQMGDTLRAVEEPFLPVVAAFVAPLVSGMFGSQIDADAFAKRSNSEARNAAARTMVDTFLNAITDEAPEPSEPGQAGARRLAAAGLHATLEGWFLATVPEILSDLLPFEMGHFDEFRRLPEDVIATLGVGRLIRRALGPLVNATAVQPMTWATNQKYRPTRLATATIIREFFRGNIGEDDVRAELAIAGYQDGAIEALINEQRKFLDTADLAWMVWQGEIDVDAASQTLRDQGWDAQTASKHFNIDGLKRDDALHRTIADAAISAYADRRIDGSQLGDALSVSISSDRERSVLRDVADAKRALRIQYLSSSQAEACVKGGILPFSEYRAALEREGYVADAIDALEMLLRKALDDKATLDDLKARQFADKQAAAQEKADAVAAKKADIDAANALKRRGAISTLEDAVVKGLIPTSRLAEVLAAQFDADTVAIYTADVDAKRLAFLAQQQKADDAAKRANNKGLSIGELQDALAAGYLTASELRARLVTSGLNSDDVAVLLQVMQQKAADVAAAKALHEQAASRAAKKTITLQQADALARAGHWTIAQYQAFVRGLGYQDADAASLTALLSDAIAKDAAARALREKTGADNPQRGLTLEQFRNAVLSGSKTIEDFAQFLTAANYNADAIAVLVPELQDAVAAADAARARRDRTDTALHGRELSVSDLARAAQLGFLSPADYQAALVARGYSAADVSLELDLLVAETATKKTPAPAADTVEALVAAGIGSPLVVATARRADVAAALAAAGASLDEIEGRVAAGALTLDAYTAMLADRGVDALDVELLRALLVATLTKAPEKAK